MNNCEEKIPTASSTPTPVVQDTRCYTIEDLMAMLILSRPTVCRLLKQNEFRWFKVGGAYRISKTSSRLSNTKISSARVTSKYFIQGDSISLKKYMINTYYH